MPLYEAKEMNRKILTISLVLCVCIYRACGADVPPLQWGNNQVRIVPSPTGYGFQVEVASSDAVKSVRLSDGYESILKLSLVRDRLVVVGDQGYGSMISIVDLEDCKEVFWTLCFRPVVSPDGSYVAFERFFPRMTPRDFEWPQVEILDVVAKSPIVQALYPPFEAPDRQSADFHAREEHVPISPLVWSEDSRHLVYFDKGVLSEQEDRWKNYTIHFMVFEFDKTKRTNTTKSAIVDVDGFVDHSFPKPLDEIAFGIQSLEFVDDSILEATVFPHEYLAITRFRFDIKKAIASGHLDPAPYSDGVAGN